MEHVDLIGWAAASMTLLAYSQKTMVPLRLAAVTSNILFIGYGYFAWIPPTLVLHSVLLPFNAYRLLEIYRQIRRVRQARSGRVDPLAWINGLVPPRLYPAGATVFSRGDRPDSLYFLKSGQIALDDIGIVLEAGTIFGEIAFFTEARERTQTARCVVDCEIVAIGEAEFMRAYYRNPAFAMYLVRLVATRLMDNARREGGAP